MKEAACFLYSDDCCYAAGAVAPFGFITPEGNDTAVYYLNEADRLYLAGSYKQAAELYRKAVGIDPADPAIQKGWLNLGNALFFMRRYKESLDAYDSALSIDPQNENALLGKAGALSALNRTDEVGAVMGVVERL
jgi:tetratricopeptide (TPR) repeat protein